MSSNKFISPAELAGILATTGSLDNLSIDNCRWPDTPSGPDQLTLHGCELSNVTLNGTDLEGLNARNCAFMGCSFSSAILRESHFTDCRFYNREEEEGCAFDLADLVAAEFRDCNLSMCDFSRSRMYRTEIIRCQAQGAVFSLVDCTHKVSPSLILGSGTFRDTNFTYCDFTRANLMDCDLSSSRFNHATLDDASLEGSNLMDADLTAIHAHHLTLRGADLRNAMIAGLDLRKIDLTGVRIMEWQQRFLLETVGMTIFAD
jgi:fluoroquinolone resistance protein